MVAPTPTVLDGQPIALDFQPGVQRDNTRFDAQRYLDLLWCRFRGGRPRKMLGYKEAFDGLRGVPRRAHIFYSGDQVIVHVGTTAGIQQVVLDNNGDLISSTDRTPPDFLGGPAVGWTIDAVFDTVSNVTQIVAHAATDTQFLAGGIPSLPVIGQIDANGPLLSVTQPANIFGGIYTPPAVIGGVVAVQPYVFAFDANGRVFWCAPNLVNLLGVAQGTSGAGQARISAQKIVAAASLRGGGAQSPAALFWSLSELIAGTFVGGGPQFAFNTISPSSSILSSDAVIEYDGLYFWAGIDRFLVFNGTTVEIPNGQNQDWFFDNMNWPFAAKSFAFKVPRSGEIWFCAPLFGNTEPSHAAIFNVRENYWYDTKLPDGGRSCGFAAQGLRFPIMGGVELGPKGFSLWVHENGYDKVGINGKPAPIKSYFETGYFGGVKNSPADDRSMSMQQLEPDFIQTGDLSGWLITTANARGIESATAPLPIKFIPESAIEELPSFSKTARLARLHVESNVLGGYYVAGRTLLHMKPGDGRRTTRK